MFGFFKRQKSEPSESAASDKLVLSREEINRKKEEIEKYKQSTLEKDEKFYENLGLLFSEIGENSQAMENLEKSMSIKPTTGDGFKKLMTLYNHQRSESAKNGDGEGIEYYMNKMDELRQIARKYSV